MAGLKQLASAASAAAKLPNTRRTLRYALRNVWVRAAAWWIASLLVLGVYALARASADDVGMPRHGSEIETTFFGSLPTVWLQQHLFELAPEHLEWATVVIHSSWFFVPPLAALLVTWKRPDRVGSFFRWWITLELVAVPLFVLFPTQPPWMESNDVTRIIALRFGGQIDDPNPYAAVPSLHVAFPLLLGLWFAREEWTAPAAFMICYTALVALEVVFAGEHYVMDVIAAGAVAGAIATAARLDLAWARRHIQIGSSLVPRAVAWPPPAIDLHEESALGGPRSGS